jgi:hypothetical protein
MKSLLASRLSSRGAFERVFRERLSEPAHLNLASLAVAAFGGYRAKVYFDLAFRQYTAFCLLDAADRARSLGLSRISAIEFGVASGAGLLNICENARKVSRITGVEIFIFGFDTGAGLPPPRSYRDHPELYREGDFPMDFAALEEKLPPNAKLILGDIAKTVPALIQGGISAPLGYVAIDVDYFWSAEEALKIFIGSAGSYLPLVNIYLDDCHNAYHNPACGEMLACADFNQAHSLRQIYPYTALREKRLFKRASWISKIYAAHILDHPVRSSGSGRITSKIISNPYIEARQATA